MDDIVSVNYFETTKSIEFFFLTVIKCTCYPGWGLAGKEGGDCSERFCDFELAWVDGPTKSGDTHKYAECANKGICDRSLGECACFPGYEGKACGRQTCPSNCSGHGTCEFMKDLKFGKTFHDFYDGSDYSHSGLGVGGQVLLDKSWDTDRARSCVCDGEWTGVDCNMRMCPVGTDIMDVVPSVNVPQVQTITLFTQNNFVPAGGLDNDDFNGQTFALQYTSQMNQTFATQPIAWDLDTAVLASKIESALKVLPYRVIDDVSVSVDDTSEAAGVIIELSFMGAAVEGQQHKLEVLAEMCSEGCTPLITGLANLRTWHASDISTVKITTSGSHKSFECGNRGKCNYITGLCGCFEGFGKCTCFLLLPIFATHHLLSFLILFSTYHSWTCV